MFLHYIAGLSFVTSKVKFKGLPNISVFSRIPLQTASKPIYIRLYCFLKCNFGLGHQGNVLFDRPRRMTWFMNLFVLKQGKQQSCLKRLFWFFLLHSHYSLIWVHEVFLFTFLLKFKAKNEKIKKYKSFENICCSDSKIVYRTRIKKILKYLFKKVSNFCIVCIVY